MNGKTAASGAGTRANPGRSGYPPARRADNPLTAHFGDLVSTHRDRSATQGMG
jgi:hypothetical protein